MKFKLINLVIFSILLFQSSLLSQGTTGISKPVDKWAEVLIYYCLGLQPEQKLMIITEPAGQELALSCLKVALNAGANPIISCNLPGQLEIFTKYANDKQLAFADPMLLCAADNFDAILTIYCPVNTKELKLVPGDKINKMNLAYSEFSTKIMEKIKNNKLKMLVTTFPTNALAQESDMGLNEYTDFYYRACLLDSQEPVKAWQELIFKSVIWKQMFEGKEKVQIKGPEIDLTFSIKDRKFIISDGTNSFPDGEIYTSPVENSVNGWVKFSLPGIYDGNTIDGIKLVFKDGRITEDSAITCSDLLRRILNTDIGSRILGEFGIGTNYGINRFTKNIATDEKIGGTIHFGIGMGRPECGGINRSAINWKLIYNMRDSQILVDDVPVYINGNFLK